MYTITRQNRWDDGKKIVEITSGGRDYTNPDALVKKYDGEFDEFLDPIEAVEKGIEVAESWQRDSKEPIYVALGYTGGSTVHFDEMELNEETYAALRKTAKEVHDKMPKCEHCGDLLPERYYRTNYDLDAKFCSDYCGDTWAQEQIDWNAMHE